MLISRIAPTPSGFLHLGNAYNFYLTNKLCRKNSGRLYLRIDDLDSERIRDEYIEDIFYALEFLEIEPDEGASSVEDFKKNFSQNNKTKEYQKYLNKLSKLEESYFCSCSRKKIKDLLEKNCPCVSLEKPLIEGISSLKIKTENVDIGVEGTHVSLKSSLGDFIVQKKDLKASYQLASLVDDFEAGVNFIVRGEDLLGSTAAQLYLAKLLGLSFFSSSKFLHHPLLLNEKREKCSKSAGSFSLRSWIDSGKTLAELIKLWEKNSLSINFDS